MGSVSDLATVGARGGHPLARPPTPFHSSVGRPVAHPRFPRRGRPRAAPVAGRASGAVNHTVQNLLADPVALPGPASLAHFEKAWPRRPGFSRQAFGFHLPYQLTLIRGGGPTATGATLSRRHLFPPCKHTAMGPPLPRIRPKSRLHTTYRSCSAAEAAACVCSPRPPMRSNTCRRPGAQHPESASTRPIARGPGSAHALGSKVGLAVWAGRQTSHRHRCLPVSQLLCRMLVNLIALTTGPASLWLLRQRHAVRGGSPPWHRACRTHPGSALKGSPLRARAGARVACILHAVKHAASMPRGSAPPTQPHSVPLQAERAGLLAC